MNMTSTNRKKSVDYLSKRVFSNECFYHIASCMLSPDDKTKLFSHQPCILSVLTLPYIYFVLLILQHFFSFFLRPPISECNKTNTKKIRC